MKSKTLFVVLWAILNYCAYAQVSYLGQIRDGEDGVYGLRGTRGIVMSNDKKNIYVASQYSLSSFLYNQNTNEITFQESYLDNTDGMNGFFGASCIILSKDDRHVYISSENENCITIMNRDTATGMLSLNNIVYDLYGIYGLMGVHSIAISDDDSYIYTTAWNGNFYTEKLISVYLRNHTTGGISHIQSISQYVPGGLHWPKSIKLSRDNNYVYVSSQMDNAISVFQRDSFTGKLTHIQFVENGVNGVQGLWSVKAIEISHDDLFLYAITRNALTVFTRDRISGQLNFLETHTDNTNGVDGLYGNYSMTVSPDNKNVYTVSNLDSSLVTFSRDAISGLLTFSNKIKAIDYWIGDAVYSTSSMISDNDNLLFTIYWENSLCSYERDSLTGTITPDTAIIDNQGASIDGLRGARFVDRSPDNKFLYVASYLDGVSTYKRDENTGRITQYQIIKDDQNGIDGIKAASSICAIPGNKYVLVTGEYDNALTLLRRNSNDSLIHLQTIYDNTGAVNGLNSPSSVLISNDLKHVYVGSKYDSGISVFDFNSTAGYLSFNQFIDFFELFGFTIDVDEIHITQSGKYVFAVSEGYYAVYMFERNSITGELLFVDKITEGEFDPIKMDLDISNDDNYVYISNETKSRIHTFKINEQLNKLELIQVIDSNVINGSYIYSVSNIKVGQDDRLVYTTSSENSILVIYKRDVNTGLLEYLFTFSEAYENFQGLDQPSSVILDSSNSYLYITSSAEHAISTFKIEINSGIFLNDSLRIESIFLHPNPTRNIIYLDFQKQYNTINIDVFSLQGEEVIKKSFKNMEKVMIDISNIPNNIYIVRIQTDNSFEFKKIIKQ